MPPLFGVAVTVYFWWQNIQGIHESSEKAMRIMQITTVMVVMLIIWCLITMLAEIGSATVPPLPAASRHSPATTTNRWAGYSHFPGLAMLPWFCCWSASATRCWR